jgi:alkylhydroperoxidase/carboxymuconolactone decarboxylase family protein YurZ
MERLLPIRSDEVNDERSRKILGWLEANGKDVHMAHLFANVTHVFPSYISMSDALMNKSALAPRLRELTIVRLAVRLDAEYEWWEHRRMAQQDGVTVAELDAIRDGQTDGLDLRDEERFVLAVADEWVDADNHLSEDTWTRGRNLLGDAALVDLVFVLAWWGAWVPAVVRAFDITVPAEAGDTA